MPSDQSTWLISAPLNGDTEGLHHEFSAKVAQHLKSFPPNSIAQFNIPSFKVCSQSRLLPAFLTAPLPDWHPR